MLQSNLHAISDYLNTTFPCSCGREHRIDMARIEISRGACEKLPAICKDLGYRKILLVCDQNTWEVAGRMADEAFHQSGVQSVSHVFRTRDLVPDEYACGELLLHIDNDTDAIIAVGSGTINDLCKYISYKLNLPYIAYATAPSMDGFASVGAALIIDNLKTTLDARPPVAIVGDLNVLCAAPFPMILAGLADILGKYTCLVDWKIANIITGEYYCPEIAAMVEQALNEVVESIPRIRSCDEDVIKNVMLALVLTGIAMGFTGNSRPASGSEHHISHFWEMQFLFEGKTPVLHGTKVGIGAVACTYLYNKLLNMEIDFEQAARRAAHFDQAHWEQEIHRAYGKAAESVIALEKRTGKNSGETHAQRIKTMRENWPAIKQILTDCLPSQESLEQMLCRLDAPVNPAQVGVSRQSLIDSILYAKEVRDRYTLLQLLWDLDIADEMALALADYFEQGQAL